MSVKILFLLVFSALKMFGNHLHHNVENFSFANEIMQISLSRITISTDRNACHSLMYSMICYFTFPLICSSRANANS